MIMTLENTLKPMEKMYLILDIRLEGLFLQASISPHHLRTPNAVEGGTAVGYYF